MIGIPNLPCPAPVTRSLIRMANTPPVQLRWDGWLRPRDEAAAAATSGSDSKAGGGDRRLPLRMAYAA